MFKARKREVVEKLEQHRKEDDLQARKEKSKAELFELRKQMMKVRVKSATDHFAEPPSGRSSRQVVKKQELMVRLAQGKKP